MKHSRVKLEVGLCKGKKNYDKRETEKNRDINRDINKAMGLVDRHKALNDNDDYYAGRYTQSFAETRLMAERNAYAEKVAAEKAGNVIKQSVRDVVYNADEREVRSEYFSSYQSHVRQFVAAAAKGTKDVTNVLKDEVERIFAEEVKEFAEEVLEDIQNSSK